ncbi:unnamed protein product, partial [Gongylonema pulchrum]|uniref:Cadherin domain-containing protein n=1 Tax=Gongylonema pulchrum TaxID=637853 RepID=A0A183DKX3_9BILA
MSCLQHFSLEPKSNSNSIDLISLECVSECSKIPQQIVLLVRAVTEYSRQPFDLPISINLGDDGGQRPRFRKSVVPLSIKENSLMDILLTMDVDNPGDSNLIFILSDYESIFELDNKYGILSIRDSKLLTVDNLGERFNMSVSVSDGKHEADTAVIMVTLEP